MSGEHDERRHDYKDLVKEVREVKELLTKENGIFVRVSTLETKTNSIQTELTEHKEDNRDYSTLEKRVDRIDLRFWGLLSGLVGSILGFFIWLFETGKEVVK